MKNNRIFLLMLGASMIAPAYGSDLATIKNQLPALFEKINSLKPIVDDLAAGDTAQLASKLGDLDAGSIITTLQNGLDQLREQLPMLLEKVGTFVPADVKQTIAANASNLLIAREQLNDLKTYLKNGELSEHDIYEITSGLKDALKDKNLADVTSAIRNNLKDAVAYFSKSSNLDALQNALSVVHAKLTTGKTTFSLATVRAAKTILAAYNKVLDSVVGLSDFALKVNATAKAKDIELPTQVSAALQFIGNNTKEIQQAIKSAVLSKL